VPVEAAVLEALVPLADARVPPELAMRPELPMLAGSGVCTGASTPAGAAPWAS
jgi:hypothetical protein